MTFAMAVIIFGQEHAMHLAYRVMLGMVANKFSIFKKVKVGVRVCVPPIVNSIEKYYLQYTALSPPPPSFSFSLVN